MSEIQVEAYYKREAKELTDMLFDKGFLADDLSRRSIDWLEDYLGFVLQVKCESAARAAELTKDARDRAARREE
jgi:hypothetical protein